MSVRLIVVDDHPVVREGLSNLLADSDIEIVAEAADEDQAVQQTLRHHPDVVLLDVRLSNGSGLSALQSIRRVAPDTKVIMLSTYDNPSYVAQAIVAGAADYVLKGQSRPFLISAIRRAAMGDVPDESSLIRRVAQQMQTGYQEAAEQIPLTNREVQVLRNVAYGLSNRDIAQALQISVETVKEHVQNVLRKTKSKSRTQAAVWALRQGLI
jgi:DNA-binding NarL/FixJ family response regulator